MSRSKYKSLIILLFLAIFICALLLAVKYSEPIGKNNSSFKLSPLPSSEFLDEYYQNLDGIACPLGIGAWDIYSAFPESYSVTEQEDGTLYFGRYDDDDRYSASATITTPYLTLNSNHQVYKLSFEYFSPRTIELANNILVFASQNGQDFDKVGEIQKVYNSNENNFIEASFDVQSSVKFLRFELKIFKSTNLSHGIYLKNFSLTPKNPSQEITPQFNVEFGSLSLMYTGYAKVPEYIISCTDSDYDYIKREIVLDDSYKLAKSIDIGLYKLIVIIYNDNNEIAYIAEDSFEITKGRIERAEIDYFASSDGVIINHVNLYTSDGIVTENLGAISYFSPNNYKTSITMQESSHFEAFDSGGITLDINSEYLLYTSNPIKTFTYDGHQKEVTFDNLTGKESIVKYYTASGVYLESAPKDAGEYRAEIYIEDSLVKTLLVIIYPQRITAIYQNKPMFNRLYDGTINVYDAKATDFIFESQLGIIDDSSLLVENVHFAANIGQSYLVFDKATFGGNYVLAENANIEKISANVEKVDIILKSNFDGESCIITVLDKQYDGNTNAIIDISAIVSKYGAIENAPLTFLGVPSYESFYVDALQASFESSYAQENIPINLTIVDQTYLDRFNPNIYAKGLIFGKIYAKKVNILPSSDIEVVTKTYDATLRADVVINSVTFGSDILAQDQEIMANNQNFELSYTFANFANANVGIKEVSVGGFVLRSKNPKATKVVNSYEVNDITLSGEITPKTLSVKDQYIHIIAGQSVPKITINEVDVDLYLSYYHTQTDAENSIGQIGDFDTSIQGNYYIRVEVSFNEQNYEIEGGYKVIPLEITSQKKAQMLTFNLDEFSYENQEYGVYYKMAIGGKFIPNAVSISSYLGESYLTGMPITYDGNTGAKLTYSQGVYTAREQGLVTITARQEGNENYLAAQPVTIKILIVDEKITANDDISFLGQLYYGDYVPNITGTALFGGQEVGGQYIRKEQTMQAGNNDYFYDFVPSQKYLGQYSDIKINLYAQKATLRLNIANLVKDYYSDINLLHFATIRLIKGDREYELTQDVFPSLNLEFAFSHDIKLLEHSESSYTIGFNNSYTYYFTVLENQNYNVEIENATTSLAVNLREIIVKVIDFSKEYGDFGYSILVDIENLDNEDVSLIKDSVIITEQAKLDSSVGRYVIIAKADGEAFANKYAIRTINGFMDITKANIEFRADNLSSVYLGELSSPTFTVTGFYVEKDKEYYSQFVEITHSVTASSSVGTYPIKISCSTSSKNYEFSFVYGTYTITPATLTGITFYDQNFVYDGQTHSLSIEYDKEVWGELEVTYSDYDILEIGRYPITAVVSKENYNNLVLNAILTISPLSLSTSSSKTTATVTMLGKDLTGFDPRATLMLVQDFSQKTVDEYSKHLVSQDDVVENVLGVYNMFLTIDGVKRSLYGRNQIKIKLDGIGSTSKVRVLANVDGNITEIKHTYQNGYIVFETEAMEFALLKSASAYTKDGVSLIIGIGVGVAILVIFNITFLGYRSQTKRQRKRLIRKHKRWA